MIEIKHRYSGAVLRTVDAPDLRSADLRNADLSYADLRNADLSYADLRSADLRSADLRSANLRGANLRGANLPYVDLRSANLSYADLRSANLSYADLRSANLIGANLLGADLSYANLRSADLPYADLSGANLRSADLLGADLHGANGISETVITPDGELLVWKKCRDGVIVQLCIPADARRSNATGRKCRAERAIVLRVIDRAGKDTSEPGRSIHTDQSMYAVGATVMCDAWNPDRWVECGGGIHFFLTREEAERYE